MKHVCAEFVAASFLVRARITTSKLWTQIELKDNLKPGILIFYMY